MLAQLAALDEVSELTVFYAPPAGAGPIPLQGFPVERCDRAAGARRVLPQMAFAALQGLPLYTGFYRRWPVRRALRQAIAAARPEVVLVQGAAGAGLVAGLYPRGRTVLDMPDAEHEIFRQFAAHPGWRARLWRADTPLLERWLTRTLADFAAVSVVSAADRASYQQLAPSARYVLAPNGAAPVSPRHDPGGGRLLFLGDLTWPPNQVALDWLHREVLSQATSLEVLRVVGRGTAPQHPRIDAAGFVPDLDQEWALSVALLAPITSGSGTRVKILEAFSRGVPVIATAFAVQGLSAVPGVHYLPAESGPQFCQAIDRLLADRELRATLTRSAQELIRQRFTWSTTLTPLQDAIAAVTAQPSATADRPEGTDASSS